MNCTGKVLENLGKNARVLIEQNACGECHACGLASMRQRGPVEVIALNKVGARKDDMVTLEFSGKKVLQASTILFFIPFCAFFLGFAFGYWFVWHPFGVYWRSLTAFIAGMTTLAASYALVRQLGKKYEDFQFVITGVGESGEPENTKSQPVIR